LHCGLSPISKDLSMYFSPQEKSEALSQPDQFVSLDDCIKLEMLLALAWTVAVEATVRDLRLTLVSTMC